MVYSRSIKVLEKKMGSAETAFLLLERKDTVTLEGEVFNLNAYNIFEGKLVRKKRRYVRGHECIPQIAVRTRNNFSLAS